MSFLNKNKKFSFLIRRGTIIFFLLSFLIHNLAMVRAYDNEVSEIKKEDVIALVNTERGNHDLNMLEENAVLDEIAQNKLNNMMEDDYFSHLSPEGMCTWEKIEESGYDFDYAGENLAANFVTAKEQHQAWMNSAEHKKNILGSHFTDTGVAVGKKYVDDKRVFVTVQVFASAKRESIISSSFMPKSFESPGLLLEEDNQEKNGQLNFFKENKSIKTKTFFWFILGVIVILVGLIEYKIFFIKK